MGDIYVRVTAGQSPSIIWTVAMEFIEQSRWSPPQSQAMDDFSGYKEPAVSDTPEEDVIPLRQLVGSHNDFSVMTKAVKKLKWRYCPDKGTGDR